MKDLSFHSMRYHHVGPMLYDWDVWINV